MGLMLGAYPPSLDPSTSLLPLSGAAGEPPAHAQPNLTWQGAAALSSLPARPLGVPMPPSDQATYLARSQAMEVAALGTSPAWPVQQHHADAGAQWQGVTNAQDAEASAAVGDGALQAWAAAGHDRPLQENLVRVRVCGPGGLVAPREP